MSDHRMFAKYVTRCPRCRGRIEMNTAIVQDEVLGWVHTLCPGDMARFNKKPEEIEYTETVIRFGKDGKIL
jgi:hypothetical protein